MKHSKFITLLLLSISLVGFSQDDEESGASNIQTYTPSKLLNKGQWDIKFFNGLYTQTKAADSNGDINSIDRQNFFTSTLEVFTGVSDSNRFNIGAIIEYRSNTVFSDQGALSVFSFKDDDTGRNGFTSFAPAIKFQPIEGVGNFSIQSAIHLPLQGDAEQNPFLDQSAWTFQNRFFFDHTLPSGDWQLFTELNTEYNFGDKDSFANKTFTLAPGVFMSYFPNNKTTVLGFVQHSQRFGDFTQNFTALGLGGKYQLTDILNLEVIYSKFVRGTDSGIGQSFNIGLRALL